MLYEPFAGAVNSPPLQCNNGLSITSGLVKSKASSTDAASAYVLAAKGIVLNTMGIKERNSFAYAAAVTAA